MKVDRSQSLFYFAPKEKHIHAGLTTMKEDRSAELVNDTSHIMGGQSQKKRYLLVYDSSRITVGESQKKCH